MAARDSRATVTFEEAARAVGTGFMSGHVGKLGVILLAFACFARPAAAEDPLIRSWSACGGNVFNTCASVILEVSGTVVTVKVQNLSGMEGTWTGTVFTGIGFDNLALAAVTSGTRVSSMSGPQINAPADRWIISNDGQIGGGLQLDLVGTTESGVDDGIASQCVQAGQLPGGRNNFWVSVSGALSCTSGYTITGASTNDGWVVFSFNVQPHELQQSDLDNTTLLVKGQNGPPNGALSTQLICAPGDCETTVVPEPSTVALLGTALIGMGVARRRRRNGAAVNQQ